MGTFATDRLSVLTLGTATLGMAYGVANPICAPDEAAADALLDSAWRGGIACFDTAPAYGEAETRIGAWRRRTGAAPLVVSKLPPVADTPAAPIETVVSRAARKSMQRLGLTQLDGYITHAAADFLRPEVRAALDALKAEKRIRAAGASVYSPEEVFAALATGAIDMIQLPLNLLDRRMIESGAIAACHQAGAAVFGRSAFLQGALLMTPASLPAYLLALGPVLAKLADLAAEAGTSILSLALRAVRDTPDVATVVVGAYDRNQLRALLAAADEPPLEGGLADELSALAKQAPAACLDPRTWPMPGRHAASG